MKHGGKGYVMQQLFDLWFVLTWKYISLLKIYLTIQLNIKLISFLQIKFPTSSGNFSWNFETKGLLLTAYSLIRSIFWQKFKQYLWSHQNRFQIRKSIIYFLRLSSSYF